VGIYQPACKLCGDCVTGCNHDAKNTLVMNYLPDAVKHGANIFTRINVTKISRSGNQWLVFFELLEYGMERFSATEMFIRANHVILAAGTMGTTRLLYKSKQEGNLSLSNRLGENFTGSPNFNGYSYNTDDKINILGCGTKDADSLDPAGPNITGRIQFYNNDSSEEKIIIQDDAIPGALATRSLSLSLSIKKNIFNKKPKKNFIVWSQKCWQQIVSVICGPHKGATRKTQAYTSSEHNKSFGRLTYNDDILSVAWNDFQKNISDGLLKNKLVAAAEVLNGKYKTGPFGKTLYQYNPLTYSPLGGCIMANDSQRGVVNHKCQVFRSTSGNEVYPGLYIMDGSVIPANAGISPMMTIAAVAERACRKMIDENNWKINYSPAPQPVDPRQDANPGFEFSHANRGYFSTRVTTKSPRFEEMKRFFLGEKLGKEDNSKIDFILVVDNDDIDTFVNSPSHGARLLGTVIAPALSPHPLTVTEGSFNLLVQDPQRERGRYLYYRYKMITREGKYYYFDGFRAIRKEKSYDGIWANMSIMYFTIHEGSSFEDPIIGTGILRLSVREFFTKQLGTLTANNSPVKKDARKLKKRFFLYFLGTMLKVFRWKIIFPGNNKRRSKDFGF
ncbi:MAG: GMC oxidoreductase, partial [Chitinophagaceae bacterium]